MSPVEIVFASLGVLLLLVSCLITGRKEEPDAASVQSLLDLTEEQKRDLEGKIDHMLEERTDYLVVKTDDYMSKISNEKIMAVHDFTTQIMEKINNNHQEVVFLYDMLNQKEAEIKATVQVLEEEKKSLKESVEDVVHLTKQLNAIIKRSEAKGGQPSSEESPSSKKTVPEKLSRKETSSETAARGKTGKGKETAEQEAQTDGILAYGEASRKAASGGKSKKASEKSSGGKAAARAKAKSGALLKAAPATGREDAVSEEAQLELPEMIQPDNKSEEILRLHRQGKSVLEISKVLGLGQGEVRLVIGLYGPA